MTATPWVSGGRNLKLASSVETVAAGIIAVATHPMAIAIAERPTIHVISVILSGEVNHCDDVARQCKRRGSADHPVEIYVPFLDQTPHCANRFGRFRQQPVHRTKNTPVKFRRESRCDLLVSG